MGLTADKLPSAMRAALQRGYYDKGKLDYRVVLTNGTSTDDVTAMGRITGDVLLSEGLFLGPHPDENGDWEKPQLTVPLHNGDARYTPGAAGGIFASPALDGWYAQLTLYEAFTTGSLVAFYYEVFRCVEIQKRGNVATLLAVVPVAGAFPYVWLESDRHDLDWDGQPHTKA